MQSDENANFNLFIGNSKTYGIDFFAKQEYKGHSAWISYTLARTEEWFPFPKDAIYRRAPHDQTHEIKVASVINLSPFYISANYVYGSGFYRLNSITQENEETPYSRFDIAGTYRFSINRINMETGLSILNVFDTENMKYINFTEIESGETLGIQSESVPFTPTIFLNLSF